MVVIIGLMCVVVLLSSVILLGCMGIFSRYTNVGVYWASPYECGFIGTSPSFDSFSFSYFSLLVFFVIFDLEISLLLNLPEQPSVWGGLYYYILFLIILSVGFLLEAILGYVRWGY